MSCFLSIQLKKAYFIMILHLIQKFQNELFLELRTFSYRLDLSTEVLYLMIVLDLVSGSEYKFGCDLGSALFILDLLVEYFGPG